MVPSTPRDVVYIRFGSFAMVFLIAMAAIGIVAGIGWLAIVAGVFALITIGYVVVAVRRQRTRGAGEAG